MAFCGFARGAAMFDCTPIENMFLIEHLPAAPEGFVKVYLYARMTCLHPEIAGSTAELAEALRMDEEAVLDAMAYWEQQGLARRLTDRPPTYELTPVQGSALEGNSGMDRAYYEYRDFNADLQSLFPQELLHPAEFTRAVDWINVMGFSQDAVLLAVKREVSQSRGKSPKPSALFRRLDRKMLAWAERGLLTEAALTREFTFSDAVRGTAADVLKRLGMRRAPSDDELATVRRWLEEMQYSREEVLAACAETTKARTPTIAYLDAILKNRLSQDPAMHAELTAALRQLDGRSGGPTPDELEKYRQLRAAGFEAETIQLAAVQCHRKRRNRFEDLEWMLQEWQKLGLFTRDAADAYVRQMEAMRQRMHEIMQQCGLERGARMDDLALLKNWQGAHGDDVIDYAATLSRGMHNPLRYMDKLLGAWAQDGITTVEAAQAQHAARQAEARQTSADASNGQKPANPALDYAQRDYSEMDERSFFVDLDQLYPEGDDNA